MKRESYSVNVDKKGNVVERKTVTKSNKLRSISRTQDSLGSYSQTKEVHTNGVLHLLMLILGLVLMAGLYGTLSGSDYKLDSYELLTRLADMPVFDFSSVTAAIVDWFNGTNITVNWPSALQFLGDIWTFIGRIIAFVTTIVTSIYNCFIWIMNLAGIVLGIG